VLVDNTRRLRSPHILGHVANEFPPGLHVRLSLSLRPILLPSFFFFFPGRPYYPNSLSIMAFDLAKIPELLPDILQLVFQQLAGDHETLLSISLTCRAWRWLALPGLYQIVDISSHNNGRQPQHESEATPIVYADQRGEYHQRNLISRQRAFLRTMTEKPRLARLVKSLTWTLIWRDYGEDKLAEIDRQTWCVFGKMVNVTHLDLASLHEVEDDNYVRQTPAGIFPKTRHLRLLGWMHRGLVKSILASLNPSRLLSLALDYVEDEGALPNGDSICADFVFHEAHHAKWGRSGYWPNPNLARVQAVYPDDVIKRQETGQAYIFPGPMWLPLQILSAHPLDSLTHLQVKVPPFDLDTDLRSFHTMFQQTAAFVVKVRATLESLVVVLGENEAMYPGGQNYGQPDIYRRECDRPWCMEMAKLFLEQQLAALNENSFPRLRKIHFEGFHLIQDASPSEVEKVELAGIFQAIEDCKFADATFIDISSVQGRRCFQGYEYSGNYFLDQGRFPELLAES
jgi:hypothetical protein